MKKVKLNIDLIPDELYYLLLKELRRQFGKNYYGNWEITATKGRE